MPMKPHKGESLNAARLREVISYDPASGLFTCLINRPGRGARAGAQAGTRRVNGRLQICIDRKLYVASNLAWLWITGEWPSSLIDHKDGNPSNDSWTNLRLADHSQNGANSKTRKSVAGLKGVTWVKARNRYLARIKVNYRTIHLGSFDKAHDAHAVYVAAAEKHFGEFARAR